MIILAFIVFCIVLAGWAKLTKRPVRPVAVTALATTDPARVQDRWTSLDDRQLTRLLDDNAPC